MNFVYYRDLSNIIVSRYTSTLTLALLLLAPFSFATETNHQAPEFEDWQTCLSAGDNVHQVDKENIVPAHFNVLSWNIQKGKNTGWEQDLNNLAQEAELVLLQEAIFIDEMKQPNIDTGYWSFSPGYTTQSYRSGIMTVSRQSPEFVCSLHAKEPWLRTPKMTSITRYSFGKDVEPLLVINIHAVNFALGTSQFLAQLNDAEQVIRAHKGPVILSGDFNAWSKVRTRHLLQLVKQNELHAVEFTPDQRTRVFGNELDYIFTRGLNVNSSRIVEVTTSDHNPLLVSLSLQ